MMLASGSSTDQESESLRFFNISAYSEEFAELGVILEDVGYTFGGVESGDLDGISAVQPLELAHLPLDAHAPELAHTELRVMMPSFLFSPSGRPVVRGRVKAESQREHCPARSCVQVVHKEVQMRDVIPEVVPDLLLKRPLLRMRHKFRRGNGRKLGGPISESWKVCYYLAASGDRPASPARAYNEL